MADQKLLRQIPKVDELLDHPDLSGQASPAFAADAVREALDELRASIISGDCAIVPAMDDIVNIVATRIRRKNTPSLRRLINATGVILHTNLGRAPLPACAAEAVRDIAVSYSTLEYNAHEGVRGSRHDHVAGLIAKLTGAEDALVVNNNAAAVLLMLAATTRGREVIVSRGELVEIGGSFRIPEVMEQSGCVLREVGTTNRTRASDYGAAIDPDKTGALLKVHTSNYKVVGFTQEASASELAELAKKHNLPFLYDLGSGGMLPLGLPDEPTVSGCITAGADAVCFSGDKLLGGPQAGVIAGKRKLIARMKAHPLARALRIDKLTLAALEATLRLYLDPDIAVKEIPTLRMLTASRGELGASAGRLAALLEPVKDQIEIVDDEGQVGGGSAPGHLLPSVVISVSPENISVTELERRLRSCEPGIIARIARDRLLIDPRTVDEADFEYIASRLITALEVEA